MRNKEKSELDLQKFIKAFDPNKFKVLKAGIEVRGISNIHSAITDAKHLINSMSLQLFLRHTAEMTAYGGFEVLKKD